MIGRAVGLTRNDVVGQCKRGWQRGIDGYFGSRSAQIELAGTEKFATAPPEMESPLNSTPTRQTETLGVSHITMAGLRSGQHKSSSRKRRR
ncbi:MAG: hypothetical protein HC909_03305 [Blastochloris sp.]|nr:hypothetical protein [Blastochloris sp.]